MSRVLRFPDHHRHLTRAATRRATVFLAVLFVAATSSVLSSAAASAAPTAGAGVAWLRAAHLVPGIGSTRVDLAPDGGGQARSVVMSPDASYGDVTSYQKVPPGTYTVTVRPTSGASSAPMLSRRFTITKGKAMTLAVIGTEKAPRLATLTDDLTPPESGDVSVRVLPAASAAQTLSVTAVGGPSIVQGAVLGQATGYKAVPAGKWTLRVTADAMAAAESAVSLRAGGVYTVIVLDGTNGSVRTKVVTDAEGMASALPKGGAQTGGGGTAPSAPSDGSLPVGPAALLTTAFGGLLLLGLRFVAGRRTARITVDTRG